VAKGPAAAGALVAVGDNPKASLPQKRSSSAIPVSRASSREEDCFSLKASSPLASYSLRHLSSTHSESVLAAELCGALLAGCDLPAALQFELPGVVSLRSLLLDPDVTLHPILGEVDFGCGPVEWVHPTPDLASGVTVLETARNLETMRPSSTAGGPSMAG